MRTPNCFILLVSVMVTLCLPLAARAQETQASGLQIEVSTASLPDRVEIFAGISDASGRVQHDLGPNDFRLYENGRPVGFELLSRPAQNRVLLVLDVSDALDAVTRDALATAYTALLPQLFSASPNVIPAPIELSVMVPGDRAVEAKTASGITSIDAFNQLLVDGAIAGPGGRPRQQTKLLEAVQAATASDTLAIIILSDASDPSSDIDIASLAQAAPVFSLIYQSQRSKDSVIDGLAQLSSASKGAFLLLPASAGETPTVDVTTQIKRLAGPGLYRLAFRPGADPAQRGATVKLQLADGREASGKYEPLVPLLDARQPQLSIRNLQVDDGNFPQIALSAEVNTQVWRRPLVQPSIIVQLQLRDRVVTSTLQLTSAEPVAASSASAESIAVVVLPEVGVNRVERADAIGGLAQAIQLLGSYTTLVDSIHDPGECAFTSDFTSLMDSTVRQINYHVDGDAGSLVLKALQCAAADGLAQQRPAHLALVLHQALPVPVVGNTLQEARRLGVSIHVLMTRPDPTGLMAGLAAASGGIYSDPGAESGATSLAEAIRGARPQTYTGAYEAPALPSGDTYSLSVVGTEGPPFEGVAFRRGSAQIMVQFGVIILLLILMVPLLIMPWKQPPPSASNHLSDPLVAERAEFLREMYLRGERYLRDPNLDRDGGEARP